MGSRGLDPRTQPHLRGHRPRGSPGAAGGPSWRAPRLPGPAPRGLRPYPGEGQSRGSIRGRNLASSSAESVTVGKGPDPPEATELSSSPDSVDSPDSSESSASSKTSSGMSSPSSSTLGDGLTICGESQTPAPGAVRSVLPARSAHVREQVPAPVNLKHQPTHGLGQDV